MNNQVLLNYFEYEQLMLSGDKNYIWLPIENKVYDIENNLSTLFFWPGGQFNSQGFDSMDVFNITNDRSIMATHGIL
jgi:cytochrome b involved in lipid metabolism